MEVSCAFPTALDSPDNIAMAEQLAGRRVVCTGPRAQDLAVRLDYAEVEHTVVVDLLQAISGYPGRTLDVVSTYTPFQKLRKLGGLV